MTHNPFNETLDRALRGKFVRVREEGTTYRGWVERVHHGRGSVVLHDVTTDDGEDLASVFVRNPSVVEVVKPGKRIEHREVDELQPHPAYTGGVTPKDGVLRDCYRTRSAGSFPVVREDGTILNGHKRVAAAEAAGLERHPVEVVEVTDEQARELVALAHRGEDALEDTDADDEEGEQAADSGGEGDA